MTAKMIDRVSKCLNGFLHHDKSQIVVKMVKVF